MNREDSSFVRGNDRVNALLSEPERASRVELVLEEMKQADREYAMGLAMIRQAAQLTQQDIADSLGVSQVAIQKTEQRADMLLSTLRRYLLAAGADLEITVRWPDGRHAELTLEQIGKSQ